MILRGRRSRFGKELEVSDMTGEQKVDRRGYLKTVGGAVAGLAIGGAAGYLLKPSEVVERTQTITQTETQTRTVTGTVTASPVTTTPTVPQILRIGRVVEPAGFDGHRHQGNSIYIYLNVYDTVTSNDMDWATATMSTNPGLATSWELIDPLAWRFNLRKGIKFHCGDDFTAEAVKHHFDVMINPDAPDVSSHHLPWLKYPTIVEDDYTVLFEMKYESALHPLIVGGHGSFIECPRHYKEYGADYGLIGACGTGPFMWNPEMGIGEWKRGEYIQLLKNEDYWRGAPVLDELIYKIIPEDSTRKMAFDRDEIDFMWDVGPGSIPALEQDPNAVLLSRPGTRSSYMAFNLRNPPTDEVKLRRAIVEAVDRESIVKSVVGIQGVPATNMCSPGAKGSPYIKDKLPPYDPEHAKQLLAELGYTPGPDGKMQKDGQALKIKLTGPIGREPNDKEEVEAWQSQLLELGIDVEVWQSDPSTFYTEMRQSVEAYHVTHDQWGADNLHANDYFANKLYSTLLSPGGLNFEYWANAEYDELCTRAAASTDPDEVDRLYMQAADMLLDNVVMIPVYHRTNLWAIKKYVKGFEGHPTGWYNLNFWKVYLEK